MSQVLTLFRLQQIDSQTDRDHSRLDAIKKILENDESLILSLDVANSASIDLNAAEEKLRISEQEVQALRVKIELTESNLYSGLVRNPKELQDLQNDAAALKRFMATLEDRLLEAMVSLETAQICDRDAQGAYMELLRKGEKQNDDLIQEQSELNKDIQRLITERHAITESLSADHKNHYELLRQQRRGVAVTRVLDNACGSCGTTLTPALIQASRSPNQISHCPSCGRILYAS
jgi:predicted  nucleic acid-binding Zn-ribbon protein